MVRTLNLAMQSEASSSREPIATRRARRSLNPVNYKELENIKLPKASRPKASVSKPKLYPVTILEGESNNDQVKIHYVGYSSDYDEWRDLCELEALDEDMETDGSTGVSNFNLLLPSSKNQAGADVWT